MQKNLSLPQPGKLDLLNMEAQLCANLQKFIKFGGHSIYFPPAYDFHKPFYLPEEHRLLLPLIINEIPEAMLMLENVRQEEIEILFPWLEQILVFCLNTCIGEWAQNIDIQTGLYKEECLFSHMESEINSLRARLSNPDQALMELPLYRICLGMIVLTWQQAIQIAKEFDYDFCHAIFLKLAHELRQIMPDDVFIAPLGRYEGRHEFGLLFSTATHQDCHKLAILAMNHLNKLTFFDEPSKRSIHVTLSAGYALFPQDMQGEELYLPIFEQTILLRDRARMASCRAFLSNESLMAFRDILRKGGRIIEELPRGKLRINLGIAANAQEGMRFDVYGEAAGRVGQIVILETRIKDSIAEIFYIRDATRLPMKGDRLELINLKMADSHEGNDGISKSKVLEISSHAEFLANFERKFIEYNKFCLGIATLQNSNSDKIDLNKFLEEFSGLLLNLANQPDLIAKYGSASLIFVFVGEALKQAQEFCLALYEYAKTEDHKFVFGLFNYPFLNYAKTESETCALKALEYGKLLEPPQIGIFNSLALNISADRSFSLGDTFNAIEEYKLALLADPSNNIARNSLGVCMASLGKYEQAQKIFCEALNNNSEKGLKSKIYYNLATLYQKKAASREAYKYYRLSLRNDSQHFYACIKLGQLNEQKGHHKRARAYYQKAVLNSGNNPDKITLAQRQLALLEASQNGGERARSILHDILLRDPNDAPSLILLAKLYLEEEKDAVMAELLARKGANLNGQPEAWLLVARALEEQNKTEEAAKIRQRLQSQR